MRMRGEGRISRADFIHITQKNRSTLKCCYADRLNLEGCEDNREGELLLGETCTGDWFAS